MPANSFNYMLRRVVASLVGLTGLYCALDPHNIFPSFINPLDGTPIGTALLALAGILLLPALRVVDSILWVADTFIAVAALWLLGSGLIMIFNAFFAAGPGDSGALAAFGSLLFGGLSAVYGTYVAGLAVFLGYTLRADSKVRRVRIEEGLPLPRLHWR